NPATRTRTTARAREERERASRAEPVCPLPAGAEGAFDMLVPLDPYLTFDGCPPAANPLQRVAGRAGTGDEAPGAEVRGNPSGAGERAYSGGGARDNVDGPASAPLAAGTKVVCGRSSVGRGGDKG